MIDWIETLGTEIFRNQLADSPKLLAYLEANFSGTGNALLRRQLLGAVDESTFSLRQWVESLRVVQSWLDTRGLELPIKDQIGYVHCAGESVGSGANLSHLPSLVADMLEAYGCERAVNKA